MAFDFKKEYKEFYMPKNKPEIVTVPPMKYVAVRGVGDPNEKEGEYQKGIDALYAVSYMLKVNYKSDYRTEGFFEYVAPPLEGFWWQEGADEIDYENTAALRWISAIRLPDFVEEKNFMWAVKIASEKKKTDCSIAELLTVEEGLCAQILHGGSFDSNPATIETIEIMDAFIRENGYVNDFREDRWHHEIYLSDARKIAPEEWKKVIRHPILKAGR